MGRKADGRFQFVVLGCFLFHLCHALNQSPLQNCVLSCFCNLCPPSPSWISTNFPMSLEDQGIIGAVSISQRALCFISSAMAVHQDRNLFNSQTLTRHKISFSLSFFNPNSTLLNTHCLINFSAHFSASPGRSGNLNSCIVLNVTLELLWVWRNHRLMKNRTGTLPSIR